MNKKEKAMILIIFPAAWILFYIFSIIKGDIKGVPQLLYNLLPLIPAFILGGLIYLFIKKFNCKYRIHLLAVFIIIEQAFKIIIKYVIGVNTKFEIIKNWLYFRPFTNTHGSYLNSMLNISVPFIWINIFKILFVMLIIFIYKYLIYKNFNTKLIETGLIFLLAGSFCSLIDTLFWGGSLDWLMLHNMFVTDLKDVYIDIGAGCIISAALVAEENDKNNTNIVKDFILYTFKKH